MCTVLQQLTRPKGERNTLVGDDDTEAIVEDDDGEGNNVRKTRGKRKPPAIDFDGTVIAGTVVLLFSSFSRCMLCIMWNTVFHWMQAVPLAALSAPKAVSSRSRRGKKPIDKTLLSQDYISR